MIKAYAWNAQDNVFEEQTSFERNGWIQITDAQSEDLEVITTLTKLSIQDIADGLDNLEIPRIESIDDCTVIFLRSPGDKEGWRYTNTLTVIISKDFFITISPEESEEISSIIGKPPKNYDGSKTKLFITLLERIGREYSRNIRRAQSVVTKQKKAIHEVDNEEILNLIEHEDILNQYLSALVPLKLVLEDLNKERFIKFTDTEREYYEDVQNMYWQSTDICNVSLKSLRSLRDAYQIIFTNNLNKTMKSLTNFTIFMTIPAVVGSIYGMNVALPYDHHPLAFWIVVGMALVTSAIVLLVFYKKRML